MAPYKSLRCGAAHLDGVHDACLPQISKEFRPQLLGGCSACNAARAAILPVHHGLAQATAPNGVCPTSGLLITHVQLANARVLTHINRVRSDPREFKICRDDQMTRRATMLQRVTAVETARRHEPPWTWVPHASTWLDTCTGDAARAAGGPWSWSWPWPWWWCKQPAVPTTNGTARYSCCACRLQSLRACLIELVSCQAGFRLVLGPSATIARGQGGCAQASLRGCIVADPHAVVCWQA